MFGKKSSWIIMAGLLTLFFSTSGWAGGVNLTLKTDNSHPEARGTASISEGNIKIEAEGLRPNGVYTAWFVNMKPEKQEAGAGISPFMFRADTNGNGLYSSVLGDSPFGKWSMLMVVLHPTGDPENMKSMVPALSAKIPNKK